MTVNFVETSNSRNAKKIYPTMANAATFDVALSTFAALEEWADTITAPRWKRRVSYVTEYLRSCVNRSSGLECSGCSSSV